MLFKILQGPSSRIDTATTPFHEGWAYYTPDDNGFYIDTKVNEIEVRQKVNRNEIFVAMVGTTTSAEIASKLQAGYTAAIVYDDDIPYLLSGKNADKCIFTSMAENDGSVIVANYAVEGSTWTKSSYTLPTVGQIPITRVSVSDNKLVITSTDHVAEQLAAI